MITDFSYKTMIYMKLNKLIKFIKYQDLRCYWTTFDVAYFS